MKLVDCDIDPSAHIAGTGKLERVKVGPNAWINGHGLIMIGGEIENSVVGSSFIKGNVVIRGSIHGNCNINGNDIEINSGAQCCTITGNNIKVNAPIKDAVLRGNGITVNCTLDGHRIGPGTCDRTPLLIKGELFDVQEAGDRIIRIGCTTLPLDIWEREAQWLLRENYPDCRAFAYQYYKRIVGLISELRGWGWTPKDA